MTKILVPFLDLRAQHAPLRTELLRMFGEVIDASAFASGPFVAKFEEDYASFCQARHAIAVGNGTDAIWFALLALGIGAGDEVITVPATFMATAEAISYCGATPVFVDIDENTYTMDPAQLERAITPRTKAIIPVHLYGQMANMDPILEIARRRGLHVIEDACQAHGAEYRGCPAGTLGDAGCFSFYPGKNLGALGEGGGVVTNNDALAAKIRILRDHGQDRKYHHALIGWNGRMDGLQAAALSLKLRRLPEGNAARREHAMRYEELLAGCEQIVLPRVAPYGVPVFHLYVVRVKNRDQILRRLGERGIVCGIHYPVPIHLQEAYRILGYGPGDFPVTERCANEILSLPMFPELTTDQIKLVARELLSAVAETREFMAARA